MGNYSELGLRLSQGLTRVSNIEQLQLMPLIEVRGRLHISNGIPDIMALPPRVDDFKRLFEAVDCIDEMVRLALVERELNAFVEHSDGRIYRIPNFYWGTFHDYRPLTGAGFFTDPSHGQLAESLNGCGVFLARQEVEEKWPAIVEGPIWTTDKMEKWWKLGNYTNGKTARNAFMKLPNTSGLCSTFEQAWKDGHPHAHQGRPNKSEESQKTAGQRKFIA